MARKKPTRKGKKGRKTEPLAPEAAAAIERQFLAFTEKFGRPPDPGEPVSFDPNADEPTPLVPERVHRDILETMIRVGVPADMIYAFNETGLLIDGDSWDNAPEPEKAEYGAALDEFVEKYGEPHPFHTGGFEPAEDSTPVFVLDGAMVSEYCINDPAWLMTLVKHLMAEKAWFMAEPPRGTIEFWTLYVRLPSVAIVNEVLGDTNEGSVTRGLHTAGWGEETDGSFD